MPNIKKKWQKFCSNFPLSSVTKSLSSIRNIRPQVVQNTIKFTIQIKIHDLIHYPYSGTNLLVKYRIDGTHYKGDTTLQTVHDNIVKWNYTFPSIKVEFKVNDETNTPYPLNLHLSLKEVEEHENQNSKENPKERQSKQKRKRNNLGCVDINLAEYLLTSKPTRGYFLENTKFNSSIRVSIICKQIDGNPMFCAPAMDAQASTAASSERFLSTASIFYNTTKSNYTTSEVVDSLYSTTNRAQIDEMYIESKLPARPLSDNLGAKLRSKNRFGNTLQQQLQQLSRDSLYTNGKNHFCSSLGGVQQNSYFLNGVGELANSGLNCFAYGDECALKSRQQSIKNLNDKSYSSNRVDKKVSEKDNNNIPEKEFLETTNDLKDNVITQEAEKDEINDGNEDVSQITYSLPKLDMDMERAFFYGKCSTILSNHKTNFDLPEKDGEEEERIHTTKIADQEHDGIDAKMGYGKVNSAQELLSPTKKLHSSVSSKGKLRVSQVKSLLNTNEGISFSFSPKKHLRKTRRNVYV